LTESDGLGFHPAPRDYVAQLKTANGTVRGAPVRLAMVEIGGRSRTFPRHHHPADDDMDGPQSLTYVRALFFARPP
jgi:hypothetical protein